MSTELPFKIPDDEEFVRGMRLTPGEIEILDRYIGIMEQAVKNPVEFAKSGALVFTPGALLAVAVAKFAYDVYQDYGLTAVTPELIQSQWKSIAKELAEIAELESAGDAALGVDTYAKLRRGLMTARQTG